MSGITSSTGLFSGINSSQIIEQLLGIEAAPRTGFQQRVAQFQLQQTSYLDLNSRLSSLKAFAKIFKDSKTFQAKAASTSNDKVLTAAASAGAAPGTYSFIVDRLVSSQQFLSKGFASKDAAQGATSIVVESAQARLDKDISLSDLNGGAGIARGKFTITDSGGRVATIDLTKAATVEDVLSAINNNGTAVVTASVLDGRFVIKDNAGGSISVGNAPGSTTASSLGIAGTASGTLTGSNIYTLSRDSSLAALNDGNGVYIKSVVGTASSQFSIKVGTTNVAINLGDVYVEETVEGQVSLKKTKGAVTTVGGAIDRINETLSAAGFGTVKASINAAGNGLKLADSAGTAVLEIVDGADGTASQLGLSGTATGEISGKRILAGLRTVLAQSLNGGKGLAGDGVLNFKLRDGSTFSVNVSNQDSLDQIAAAIQNASGSVGNSPKLQVAINSKGTGLSFVDATAGSDNLTITGTNGADTAVSLGISTGAAGTTNASVDSGNLQRQYISKATLVTALNAGKGIGTGTFRITDSSGTVSVVDIADDTKTVGDLLDEINSRGLKVKAQINAQGDGIEIVENVGTEGAGAVKIKIEDATGSVAKNLDIAKESTAVGTGNNKIVGTGERTIALTATDSLSDIATKINSASAGVSATVINDGGGATPFRLNITSNATGRAGRLIIDAGAFDLGLKALDAGEDSRVFFGSTDPSKAILLTSSTNTLDNVVSNVKIDLKGVDANPVSLTISSDTSAIENSINDFLKAFNSTIDRIDSGMSYNSASNKRGPLFGDTTAQGLRNALYRTLQAPAKGINSKFTRLLDIGVEVGSGGELKLNADRLRRALNEDPAAVEALFVAKTETKESTAEKREYSALGAMGAFEVLADQYIDSVAGVLVKRNQNLDDQIKSQQSRITDLDAKIERRRATLQAQFLAMEKAIAQLQSQQSSISSIGSLRR